MWVSLSIIRKILILKFQCHEVLPTIHEYHTYSTTIYNVSVRSNKTISIHIWHVKLHRFYWQPSISREKSSKISWYESKWWSKASQTEPVCQSFNSIQMYILVSHEIQFKSEHLPDENACNSFWGGWGQYSQLVWSVQSRKTTFMRWKMTCEVNYIPKHLQNCGNWNAKKKTQVSFVSC